jgi:hypothetical protein
MSELPLALVASVAIIAAGVVAARFLRRADPLISVSQPTKALVLGTALGGPFVLEQLNALPVGDGWDIVAALALSLGLYLFAARLVGVGDGMRSDAGGTDC